ncbi:hypothetical protein FSARC_11859 [Fusarium sarcochroum]|uniref:N-acetyltransferase domain-containing protein n=1 Tax=Fusarium sarcochroum TaxID=1208366 RepID=A0A8H4WYS2_9HYPO|nr:hypothetical protein FSARC_11859 [Fusarium sarcochroum]
MSQYSLGLTGLSFHCDKLQESRNDSGYFKSRDSPFTISPSQAQFDSAVITMLTLQRMLRIEARHLEYQVSALRIIRPEDRIALHQVAGSTSVISSDKYDRKLNHTIGLGSFKQPTIDDLQAIEALYKDLGLKPQFDVSLPDNEGTINLLLECGYVQTGGIDTFVYNLKDSVVMNSRSFNIDRTTDVALFINASVAGFATGGRSLDLLNLLSQMVSMRENTYLYEARDAGGVLGTAVLSIVESEGDKIGYLYHDSTLPKARGHGVHQALIGHRLQVSRDEGCTFAIALARASSGSARNLEKLGFVKVFGSHVFEPKLGII